MVLLALIAAAACAAIISFSLVISEYVIPQNSPAWLKNLIEWGPLAFACSLTCVGLLTVAGIFTLIAKAIG